MQFSADKWDELNSAAQNQRDEEIARMFRERNAAEVSHLTDDELRNAVGQAREAASAFGLNQSALRMRFIMLGVLRLPRFWLDETLAGLLNAPTGTPDSRFGDVCALFKLSADRAGLSNHVWWS